MTSETWQQAKPLVVAGLILLGVLFLSMALFQVRQVLAVLFLGVVVGVTLNPFVDAMSRIRVPRVPAILLVYVTVGLILALITWYGVFEFGKQDFSGDLDKIRQDYESLREGTSLPTAAEVEEGLKSAFQGALGGLAGQVLTLVSAVAGIATIMFTALLLSITQERIRGVLLSFIPPSNRDRAQDMLRKYASGLRGYARGEIIAMTTIGVITYVGLTLIGVPLAVPLAFIAFLFELLPMIGPWLALIPALVVGFTQGTWTGVEVLALYLGIQAFESYVLTPMVHGRESNVPALLIFVAVVIGGALMGILGAIVALPIAILLHITYFELIEPWNRQRFGEANPADADQSTETA